VFSSIHVDLAPASFAVHPVVSLNHRQWRALARFMLGFASYGRVAAVG
jgi:hypothetical protein